MSSGIFGIPVKHRVFVSYHHGGDQGYYDAFSRAFHDTYDVIYDNSLERQVDSDDVDYVRRRISALSQTAQSWLDQVCAMR